MIGLEVVFVALGVVILAMNVVVARRLWASAMFGRGQKIAQTLLLWLLPGSVFLIWGIVREPAVGGRREGPLDDVIDALAGADDVGTHGGHHGDHHGHHGGHFSDHGGHFGDHGGIDGGGHG